MSLLIEALCEAGLQTESAWIDDVDDVNGYACLRFAAPQDAQHFYAVLPKGILHGAEDNYTSVWFPKRYVHTLTRYWHWVGLGVDTNRLAKLLETLQ